jgi:hypothetical protein
MQILSTRSKISLRRSYENLLLTNDVNHMYMTLDVVHSLPSKLPQKSWMKNHFSLTSRRLQSHPNTTNWRWHHLVNYSAGKALDPTSGLQYHWV